MVSDNKTSGRFQNYCFIDFSLMHGFLFGLMESSSLLWIPIKFLRGIIHIESLAAYPYNLHAYINL